MIWIEICIGVIKKVYSLNYYSLRLHCYEAFPWVLLNICAFSHFFKGKNWIECDKGANDTKSHLKKMWI